MTIYGTGNYEGTRSVSYRILQRSIQEAILVENKTAYYDGTEHKPQIKLSYNGKTLTEGIDYTLPSTKYKNIGTYTVDVSGKGNYKDTKSVKFEIKEPDANAYKVTLDKNTYTYTGGEICPNFKITFNGKDVTSTFNYYYNDNIYVGTGYIYLWKYDSSYNTIEIEKNFKIVPKHINLSISGLKNSYSYTGHSITPDFDCYVPEDAEYDVTTKYINNKNVGTATIIVTINGNYSGTVKRTFNIIPGVQKSITMYKYDKQKLKVKSNVKVKYKSTNKKIATINSKGRIKAKKKGKCYILVTANGKTAKVKLRVKKLSLNKKKITINKGYSSTLRLKGKKKKIKWTSSNPRIAKVNKKGKVTGVYPGNAIITAKVGKSKFKCKVKVKKIAEVQLTDFGFEKNIVNGIEPWFTFKNNTNKTIKYITATVYAYNRVGDPARCEIHGVNYSNLRFVGPIKKHKSRYYEKDAILYNGTTKKIIMKKITVQFMDGSTKTYSMRKTGYSY